jgi:hypothetical protein
LIAINGNIHIRVPNPEYADKVIKLLDKTFNLEWSEREEGSTGEK